MQHSNAVSLKKPIVISRELSEEKMREIIWRAVELNASDIHINSGYKIRLDVGEEKVEITSANIEPNAAREFAKMMLSGKESLLTKASSAEPTYHNYSIKNPNDHSQVRNFRVCVITERSLAHGKTFAITARLNPLKPMSGEQLGLEPELAKTILNSRNGIALFVGGTGQGKTTTMAGICVTILQTENANKKIMVFEDPVEVHYTYIDKMPGNSISSHEVGPVELDSDVKSFDSGLHAALRSKPDILIQGEIRTKESINKAIDFSNTGHFLMATLHANDCAGALTRIYNLIEGEDRTAILTDFVSEVRLICAQRLIPLAHGGRIAVRETLYMSKEVRANLIKCNSTTELKAAVNKALETTNSSFKHKIRQLWNDGMITPDQYMMDSE